MSDMIDIEQFDGREPLPLLNYETSPQIGDVFGALAKAQGEIKDAIKDKANDHFRSKYATLAAVYEACRTALSKAGVAVVQIPYNDGKDVGVSTVLGVASGQWISAKLQVSPARYDAQGLGSVITYLRRYSLSAMVGVAPDDDDDGEAAMGRPTAGNGRDPDANAKANKPRSTRATNVESAPGNGSAPAGNRGDQREAAQTAEQNAARDVAQAAKTRLDMAIDAALDHGELDDLEKSPDWQTVKDYSPAAHDKTWNRMRDRHDFISRGPDAPA